MQTCSDGSDAFHSISRALSVGPLWLCNSIFTLFTRAPLALLARLARTGVEVYFRFTLPSALEDETLGGTSVRDHFRGFIIIFVSKSKI